MRRQRMFIKNPLCESMRNWLEQIGQFMLFIGQFFRSLLRRPLDGLETLRQTHEIGSKSLLLVGISGLSIGMVLAMQTSSTLARFGGRGLLPSMIAVAVLREIGPIITALVVSGRVGAGIAAQLGSMRVTEQIDAMEVAALYPFGYLVRTRILACLIALPILTIYADFLALMGGYVIMFFQQNISLKLYFSSAIRFIDLQTVLPAVAKTAIFGFIIGSIATFTGYYTRHGTRGVGQSAMIAVVLSSLFVIVADVLLVKLTLILFG